MTSFFLKWLITFKFLFFNLHISSVVSSYVLHTGRLCTIQLLMTKHARKGYGKWNTVGRPTSIFVRLIEIWWLMPHTRGTNQDTLITVAVLIRRCRNGFLWIPGAILVILLVILWISVSTFSIRSIDGETRIGIFATRDIKKGEHLTYDYQWVLNEHSFLCRCYSW